MQYKVKSIKKELKTAHITPEYWKLIRERIRKLYFQSYEDALNSFEYGKLFLHFYNQLISQISKKCSLKVYNTGIPKDVALFSFGSPARLEMLGESDLDLLIVRQEDNSQFNKYYELFIKEVSKYEFSKIDIPIWGTLDDCEYFLKSAITEANQVLEAKFILGDEKIRETIEEIKCKYATAERYEKTLGFQYFYFNQYYKQRGRNGSLNLKYGHGGTRDFLFPTWFKNLILGIKENKDTAIVESIIFLEEKNILEKNQSKIFSDSANFVAYLRNELLYINKNSEEEGKTFINDKSNNLLSKSAIFSDEKELISLTRIHTQNIKKLKEIIFEEFIKYLKLNKTPEWFESVNKILNKKLSDEEIEQLPKDDLINIFYIWNQQLDSKKKLGELSRSESWTVLNSLACHPDCDEKILDFMARNRGVNKGYEYLLKVIGRNPNTSKSTLKFIANNENIEMRFKEPSITRLEKGWRAANQL